MTFSLPDLPIVPLLEELGKTLADHPAAILTAPPGSGKTTLVPLALRNLSWLRGQKILMLEPRRLATRAAAARMAELLGEKVGEQVGYQVRFDRQITHKTTIEVVTEGILTRRLQSDPGLTGVGLVIFDEFHERSLHADLGLALCIDLLTLREDLRILVMSATLQTAPLSRLLGDAPVLTSDGSLYPVTLHYLDRAIPGRLVPAMTQGILQAVQEGSGDILAFLPGAGEIRATRSALIAILPGEIGILPLYGDLPKEEQDRVVRPRVGGPRRVILATDIAESSLTIPGVTMVVDGGYCRRPKFHPGSGLTRLETVRISQASADQRAGRAGRLGPGRCYRLWSREAQEGLVATTPPEIVAADLAPLLLELAIWGVTGVAGVAGVASMAWLDPPPAGAIQQARELLQGVKALDGAGQVTTLGRKMAELPIHPRLAHIIWSAPLAEKGLACDLAALLGESNPLKSRVGQGSADIAEQVGILTLFRARGAEAVRAMGGDPTICARIDRGARQLRQLIQIPLDAVVQGDPGVLLVAAYPDRVARQRPGSRTRYLLSGGRGAQLHDNDPMTSLEMLVVAELDAGQIEGRIYLAARLDERELRERFASQLQLQKEVFWDGRQGRVVARQVERFGAIELQTRPWLDPGREVVRNALLEGLRGMKLGDCLNWTDEVRSLQARVALLGQTEGGWPDLSDEILQNTLADWLGPHLGDLTRREQLSRLNVAVILRESLDWSRQRRLEEGAPTHWLAPSGSRIRITYGMDESPVLAVRIQELFGLGETPSVGWGKVPITLHLLNPAKRPVQVTGDLRGFWERTWPEVRKELQGRYPKHHWPEDPWTAKATARAKPRNPNP